MADETVRNVWDVIGFPNNADRVPIQEREQSLCTNGTAEGNLDKAQSVDVRGIRPNQKATAEPSTVSIAGMSCSTDIPDEPNQNGGDSIEEIIERYTQRQGLMKVLTSEAKDLSIDKAGQLDGETSAKLAEHVASVPNGSAELNLDRVRNNLSHNEEHNVVVAVSGLNNNQAEPLELRQERSVFEHINGNFRSPVILAQNHVNGNVSNGTGIIDTPVVTRVATNTSRVTVGDEKEEKTGNAPDGNNIFERVRINSYIDSLTQRNINTREGKGGFPFSEKLRRLTNINKEGGSNMSTTVQPLRTGYDAAFQQLAPANGNSATNTITARLVNNGHLQPVGAPIVLPTEQPKVDSNLIFPSVTPLKYSNAVSSSIGAKHSYSSQNVASGYQTNTMNSRPVQPKAVGKLNLISLDSTRSAGEILNGEKTQANLKATHLVGPFIGTGPPPPNTYVAAVRPAHVQSLPSGFQLPAFSQLRAVSSPLKGRPASSSFQLVLPVLPSGTLPRSTVVNQIIMPEPISHAALERNKSSIQKQRDLICSERLISSPEVPERVFRPVSPAKNVLNERTSPRFTYTQIPYQAPSDFSTSPLRGRRSVLSQKNDLDRRGSVEEELADQSYECALRESANSPDIERYLRCESPVTIQSSPNTEENSHACGNSTSTETLGSPPLASNGDFQNVVFPNTSDTPVSSGLVCNNDSENVEISATIEEEYQDDIPRGKTPEINDFENGVQDSEDTDDLSKKKQNSAMIRRLEARLPSPVRERSEGDLYRDPSELTREERALQRAMMQFSEMEMKEKSKGIKKKGSFKRRLRKRPKDKQTTVLNGAKKQSGAKVWLKKLKRRRLWFSQRRSVTVKCTAVPVRMHAGSLKSMKEVELQHKEDNASEKSRDAQETVVVKRKRVNSTNANKDEQPKRKRKRLETATDRRTFDAKPEETSQTVAISQSHKHADNKPAKVRRHSCDTRAPEETKKENVPHSTSCKRFISTGDMGRKVVKRARVEIEPLQVNRQEVALPKNIDGGKADRSHRVKTYMLVTAYQGFRDFKPVVLESRTRGKSKQPDNEPPQQNTKPSEFPLLVVESVNSKPVKNSIIAENEEVQQIVENCLKARGKWRIDETLEEETSEDDILKEARKLNVNRNTGETILHKAARLGYHDTVHHHIHQGIDPNAKDNAGWTPLHEACSRGRVGVVKVLTKYGADVNACSNDGIRPIHDAAEGGHVDVLRVLLSYGADPLLATYSGNTALSCTKDPNARAFLEGFLEDADLTNSTSSSNETEGCWEFAGSCPVLDASPDHTTGIFEGVPRDGSIVDGEFEICDRPHLPTYNLPVLQSDELTSGRRNYVLLSDILEHLRIGRSALFKKARRLDIREMPWSQFMAEIADKPLCVVPKYSPPDSSTQEGVAELVPINYNLRRLLNIRVESVNMT